MGSLGGCCRCHQSTSRPQCISGFQSRFRARWSQPRTRIHSDKSCTAKPLCTSSFLPDILSAQKTCELRSSLPLLHLQHYEY